MKVLAVSDRVLGHLYSTNVGASYPDIELLIGCGDLPFYYLEYLVSALDVPLLYVRGNHDTSPQYTIDGRTLSSVQGGVDLHGQVIEHNGWIVAGLEGSLRYRPNVPLMYSESEMRWQAARLLPQLLWRRIRRGRAVDLLVTHSPPYGVHDRPDRAHTGFRVFRHIIRLFKPLYFLHGHIHVYRQDVTRESVIDQTNVINVYPYRVIEMKKDQVVDRR